MHYGFKLLQHKQSKRGGEREMEKEMEMGMEKEMT